MTKTSQALLLTLFFCWVGGAAFPSTQSSSIRELLKKIPQEDYQALDSLFRVLVFENYFAYTLFGSKPMTHKGAFYEVLTHHPLKKSGGDYIFLTNWKVWKKYACQSEFQTPNYVFLEGNLPELFDVHFLNKKNVLACIKSHLSTFREILGDEITPEGVYDSIIHSEDLYEALGNSQILYGILFGFGETNARGFHEKYELNIDVQEPTFFNEKMPKPNDLPLPYFAVFGASKETEMLRKTYEQERKKILSVYSKGNFLEITLTKLLSN
jgi:hypothetical protein